MNRLIPFNVEICLDSLEEGDKKRVRMGKYGISYLAEMLNKKYRVVGLRNGYAGDDFLLTREGEVAEWVGRRLCKVTEDKEIWR